MHEIFREYINTVRDQIRWKRARPGIAQEIETHLLDQQEALINSGLAPDAAAAESIRRMGDAVEIGMQLDRVHRPRPAWSVIAVVGVMLALGVAVQCVLLQTAASAYIPRMLFGMLLGIGAMVGAYFLDFTFWGKHPALTFGGALVLMLLTTIRAPMWHGRAAYASYLIFLLPAAYAALLYGLRGRKHRGLYAALALVVQGACCFSVPSLSGAALVLVCDLVLFSIAYRDRRAWLSLLGVLAVVALVAWPLDYFRAMSNYLRETVALALDPSLDPDGAGWLNTCVRDILSRSQFIGQGTMPPDVTAMTDYDAWMFATDYTLTYLIFRFGWISLAAVAALFTAFFALSIRLCLRQKSTLGRLMSLAVILTLMMQTVIYVSANLGVPVFAPVSLPLLSYGNTATVINLALIGTMLSVFRTGAWTRDERMAHAGRFGIRITREDGRIVIAYR